MKTQLLILALLAAIWPGRMTAQCSPNGHIFNLESLINAAPLSQFDESIAFLLNRSGNGNDLIVGAAEDARPLVTQSFLFNDAFYVGRNTSDCSAAVDGGMPPILFNGQQFLASGNPQVAVDPAHDAFFFADTYLAQSPDVGEVGVLKSSASRLLNTAECLSGTQTNSAPCFEPFAGGVDIVPLNTFLFRPVLAVDQRKTGLGNGDVYVAVVQETGGQVQLNISPCRNADLLCGSATVIGLGQFDVDAHPWIQVRADGLITVSYQQTLVSNGNTILQYKFVTCTPNGAPNPPSCGRPVIAAQPKNPATGSGGLTAPDFNARPNHVNRLESDGKTFTTFLVYAICDVPVINSASVCPKADIAVTFSRDGGQTWSTPQSSGGLSGQQFEAAMALDDSTQTVNIAYYSTENDAEKLRTQLFLTQILHGTTTPQKPHRLTSVLYDPGTIPTLAGLVFNGFGEYISVVAAGTGTAGGSKVYVHFTSTTVNGIYSGVGFPIETNTLTRFEY